MRNAPDMSQPYGPTAHSLMVCQAGARSRSQKNERDEQRIW